MDKKQIALELSEELLGEIESKKIDDHSAILKCLRIARLVGDEKAIRWLQYETSGYEVLNNESSPELFLHPDAYCVARERGRFFLLDGKTLFFGELVGELISTLETTKTTLESLKNFNLSSAGGDLSIRMVNDNYNFFINTTKTCTAKIKSLETKLARLRSQYYDYALKINIELNFSHKVANIFSQYQHNVDIEMIGLSSDTIKKLNAIEQNLNSDNPEVFSQVLTTCRRLFEDIANVLFHNYYPNYSDSTFKTKSGKEINVTGNYYLNRLSAVIEKLQDKSPNKTLIGSSIIHTIDWIENLNDLQCKGVHSDITKDEALRCIIHTYICVGDILKASKV